VVGHRGAAARAPENTLVSFELAVAEGAEALELDVHLSADGVPVVHHDPTLERTTDGRGAVAARTLAELRRLDAGAGFTLDAGRSYPYRGRGVVVPTLAEVLGAFPALPLLIEIKTATASAAVRAEIERHGASARCVVASFDARALDVFRGTATPLGATQAEVAALLGAVLRGARRLPAAPPYQVASVPPRWRGLPLPVGRFARLLRAWGRTVHVWTVDDPRTAAALWRAGVQGIISNDPGSIVKSR
jgi:glycerophosphoryl diester phosphodiesterase